MINYFDVVMLYINVQCFQINCIYNNRLFLNLGLILKLCFIMYYQSADQKVV